MNYLLLYSIILMNCYIIFGTEIIYSEHYYPDYDVVDKGPNEQLKFPEDNEDQMGDIVDTLFPTKTTNNDLKTITTESQAISTATAEFQDRANDILFSLEFDELDNSNMTVIIDNYSRGSSYFSYLTIGCYFFLFILLL